MKLNLTCGTNTYPLEIHLGEDGKKDDEEEAEVAGPVPDLVRNLGELLGRISDTTNVDPKFIKVLHRGKVLKGDPTDSLEKFGFKENDKLIVMGKARAALKDDPSFRALCDYEKKNLLDLQKTFDGSKSDLEELEKFFLDADKLKEMSKKLDKRLKIFNDSSTKHLIALDGMSMDSDGTSSDEQKRRNREKRKSLIDGIEILLNQNDALMRRLEEVNRKLEEGITDQ